MKTYIEKTIDNSVKDVSTETRRVKVAVSCVDVLDNDNDVIEKSAYNRTIDNRGPKKANMIWHLTDHKASLKDAVGKPSEIYMQDNFLVFVTDIPKTTWGNDVLEFYKSGAINSHSVGFRTLKSEPVNAGKPGEYNLIKEIFLYEGSSVLWPANENTPTLSVGKSMTTEEASEEYYKTLERFTNFTKLFKTGHLTDSSFELIEIEISQLADKLKQLFEKATQPAPKAPDPVKESLLDVLITFNNSLTLQNESRRIAEATRCA